jgi:hypothetical protein
MPRALLRAARRVAPKSAGAARQAPPGAARQAPPGPAQTPPASASWAEGYGKTSHLRGERRASPRARRPVRPFSKPIIDLEEDDEATKAADDAAEAEAAAFSDDALRRAVEAVEKAFSSVRRKGVHLLGAGTPQEPSITWTCKACARVLARPPSKRVLAWPLARSLVKASRTGPGKATPVFLKGANPPMGLEQRPEKALLGYAGSRKAPRPRTDPEEAPCKAPRSLARPLQGPSKGALAQLLDQPQLLARDLHLPLRGLSYGPFQGLCHE